jgi:alkylated DNA repair dioxygenase AlkB
LNVHVIEQRSLFSPTGAASTTVERLDLGDGEVVYFPEFFPWPDGDRLLADLDETTVWRQETLKMYGKEMPIPRLTAWYGEPGRLYSYSKIQMEPERWTPALLEIKTRVEEQTAVAFNSVLLNLYRDGKDSVAWHSDDEPELGPSPTIASVSFGATRKFQLRSKDDRSLRHDLQLTHGSLLIMQRAIQRTWQHQVPKTSRQVEPRINLTFRTIG